MQHSFHPNTNNHSFVQFHSNTIYDLYINLFSKGAKNNLFIPCPWLRYRRGEGSRPHKTYLTPPYVYPFVKLGYFQSLIVLCVFLIMVHLYVTQFSVAFISLKQYTRLVSVQLKPTSGFGIFSLPCRPIEGLVLFFGLQFGCCIFEEYLVYFLYFTVYSHNEFMQLILTAAPEST